MENYFLPSISIEYWSGFSLHPYYDDAGDGICPFLWIFMINTPLSLNLIIKLVFVLSLGFPVRSIFPHSEVIAFKLHLF